MAGPGNTKSKSFWTFWTTLPGFLTALATLITAIGGAYALWGDPGGGQERPEQPIKDVLYRQYRQINDGDYEDAYALFADRSQQIVSLEQYKAYFKERPGYAVDPYKVTHVDFQSDDAVTAEVVFTTDSAVAEPQKFVVDQQIVREDGQWRVVMRDQQVDIFLATD